MHVGAVGWARDRRAGRVCLAEDARSVTRFCEHSESMPHHSDCIRMRKCEHTAVVYLTLMRLQKRRGAVKGHFCTSCVKCGARM